MSETSGASKRAAVLTVSDGVSAGSREDSSGEVASAALRDMGFEVVLREVVADDETAIAGRIRAWAEAGAVDLVVSTGGTGMGPRDVTPEAVRPILDRELPGYGELLRADGLRHTKMAVLSRSFAGSVGRVLIVCLPGSPKAVQQGLDVLAPTLPHALDLLEGKTKHR